MNTLEERSLLLRPTLTNISFPQSDSSLTPGNATGYGYQYLFTRLSFQAPGNISRFIFAANRSGSNTNAGEYPQVDIWRQGEDGTFTRQFATTAREPLRLSGELNMYEYKEPFQYLAGDFLGVYQPLNSVLSIGFQESASSSGYRIEISGNIPEMYSSDGDKESINYIPVLTVEAQELSLPSATTPIATATTTPSTKPTDATARMTDTVVTEETASENTVTTIAAETGANAFMDVIIIAGAVVGGIIGILLFLILALVVFLLVMKRRKKTFKPDSVDNSEYYINGECLLISGVCRNMMSTCRPG